MPLLLENPAPGEQPDPGGVPAAAPAAAPPKSGRVLVLEDDPAFLAIVRDFLTEKGYTVVAVANGGEGVREVLTGDFALILCDLMMPTLPGDMFYRAVERIRPDLCHRIVFMSGQRSDPKMDDFIRSTGGCALRKPFPLQNLLDLFAVAEVRDKFRSIFDLPANAAPEAPASGTADAPSVGPIEPAQSAPLAPPQPLAEVAFAATTTPVDPLPPTTEAALGRGAATGGAFAGVVAGLVLFASLAGVLGFRYLDAQRDAAAAGAHRLALEDEWETLGPQRDEALASRPKFKQSLEVPARIAADRAKARWTPVLGAIATMAGPQIEVLDLQARQAAERPGSGEVRVHGWATGPNAREVADRFRHGVESVLTKAADGRPVSVQFERLEDRTDGPADSPQADFVMVAAVGWSKPSAAGKEER